MINKLKDLLSIYRIDIPLILTYMIQQVDYDSKIIVEEAVDNLIEVKLPIMGNEILKVGLVERPLVSGDSFFDFDAKYMNGGKKGSSGEGSKGVHGYSELPAKISEKLYKAAVLMGTEVYKAIGCSGIDRVDMLIDPKSEVVYFNEINPMPGSLYLHNWSAAGISAVALVEELVYLAESKWKQSQRKVHSFNANYLKQF